MVNVEFHGDPGPLTQMGFPEDIPEPLRALNILDSVSDAVAAVDRSWRIIYANRSALQMSRRSEGELIGGMFWELFPEVTGTPAETHLRSAMDAGHPIRFEHFYQPFDLWLEVDVHPIAAGIAVFLRDITLRMRTATGEQALFAALKLEQERLHLSEERFRVALKNSPIVVFNQNARLEYTWIYNTFPEFRNVDWLRRGDAELGDSARELIAIKRAVLESGRGVRHELAIRVGDEVRYHDFHLEPLRDESGAVTGLTGSAMDVTPLRRSQEKLAAQQKQLRTIIDGMPGLVSWVDPDLTYRFVNASYSKWMGRPVQEIEGRSLSDVLLPETVALMRPYLDRAIAGEQVSYERVLRYVDGARYVRATYVPQLNDGRVDGIVVLVQDISDWKRAEEARLESELQFRRIVEIASEGIWIVDTTGLTTFVNRRMTELLGYSSDHFIGRHFLDFIHPEDRMRSKAGFARRIEGDSKPREYRAVRSDGEIVWLDFTATTVRDGAGEATGVLAMCTDVTERRHTQEQIRQTQKLESLGVLAGGIAHDFNNLLVGILGNASLAQEMLSPSSPVRPVIESVISAGERAAQLTHQMLAYSGKGRFIVEPVNLSDVVREILPLIAHPMPRSVTVELKLSDSIPPIEADRTQLQQVVMNLVINGAEACGAQPGSVYVSTRRVTLDGSAVPLFGLPAADAGEYVCLEVKDTGSGMPDEVRARIFDPFFTTKFTGRGLGLSAVLGIIRAHKGALRIDSAPGAGTTFQVFFPAVAADGPDERFDSWRADA